MIELIKPDVENKRFKRIIFLGLDNAGKTYISRRFSKDILEYQYNPYDLYLPDERGNNKKKVYKLNNKKEE